ncbi:hypothetical protein FRC07_003213 [Ceratobasidium sp. 392]|nr:hypothetical protein FRC07_003213 [Ceratobasidium sp. 392]
MYRYQQGWLLADMQRSIDCFEASIETIPNDTNRKPVILSNYANTLIWRFERQGNNDDLDKSISIQRGAIESTPANDTQLAVRIRSLAAALRVRFDHHGQLSDLEEAITTIKRAIDMAPHNHPHQALFVGDLGTMLRDRYSRLDQIQDLENAIANHKTAVSLTPDSDSLKAGRLNDLGMSISTRFSRFGNVADLNEKLSYFEQSVTATPDTDVDKPVRLNNLGTSLRDRFERLGAMSDLEAAISYQERAIELTPDANLKKPSMLRSLGASLTTRFENLGNIEDIDRAISGQQHAVSLCPTGHSNRPFMLDALGMFLITRFMHQGELADLEQGVRAQEEAVSLASDEDPGKAYLLSNLGSSLQRRFERLNTIPDIDRAVSIHNQAVDMTPDDHNQKPRRLNNLASTLARRFIFLGHSGDIDRAVANSERAVSLTLDDNPDKPIWFTNLGSILSTRFDHTGKLVYLDDAITYQNKSIAMVNDNRPEKAMWLNNLGKSLLSRFETARDPVDLDRSISNRRLATSLTSNDHPRRPALLTSLGVALRVRFEHLKQAPDLEEAVEVLQQAVFLTPDDHPERPARLSNLGNALVNRYDKLENASDLEAAISSYRLAVRLTSSEDAQYPIWVAHWGISLSLRFSLTKQLSDLDEAIELQEKATSLMSNNHPEKSRHLRNLAHSLIRKARAFPDLRTPSSLEYVMNKLYESFRLTSGPPSTRLLAMYDLAKLTNDFDYAQSLVALGLLMDFLPSVIWLGKTVHLRYKDLTTIQNMGIMAAAKAVQMGDGNLALQWLEQGRSIVWNQTLKLRTPLDDLRLVDKALADRLEEVSLALDNAGASSDQEAPTSSYDERVQMNHRLAEEWDSLVGRVRETPGFEQFLKPLQATALIAASHSSTVVLISSYNNRCYAIVVPHKAISGFYVSLPNFSYQKASKMQEQWARSLQSTGVRERGAVKKDTSRTPSTKRQFEGILLDLWSDVVEPILDQLGYLTPRQEAEDLPRITWCATGPLSFLPLHAAGNYTIKNSTDKVFNFAVSSYTPTLSALLAKHPPEDDFCGILAVGQSTTRGMSSLPGTTEELDHIERHASNIRFTRLEGAQATHAAVLDGMHDHSWVHLACHASQNLDDPTSSALYLHDKPLDLATISRAPFKHAGLAFLSACQTATGVENLSEESVHLAAGMLMSGFPCVIATMWSVRDQDAPLIAEQVYARLIKNEEASNVDAARALHDAVGYLRQHVGEENFEAWIPYIHVGL